MPNNQKLNPKAVKAVQAPLLSPVANPASERLKLALVMACAMLLSSAFAALGTWWLMEQRAPNGEQSAVENALAMPPPAPPLYENLDPPFVVNIKQGGQSRYLQVGVALMSRHAEQLGKLKEHLPLLRSRLLILFSGQEVDGLTSAEGKEALRQKVTQEVQDIAERLTGMPVIEQALFTTLVVQ